MRKHKTTHLMAGILIFVFVGIFLLLSGRFLYIQATGEVNDVSLEAWAEEKRTASYTLDAERGKIYDSNGMTLAYDRPAFQLYAIVDEAYTSDPEDPQHVKNLKKTAETLAPVLDVEPTYLLERLQAGIENGQFQVEFGNAGKDLTQQEKEEIKSLELPGIQFREESLRYYPNGMFASHIIGIARDASEEKEDGTSDIVGVTGIEKEMNDLLSGQAGSISYQRDLYNTKLLDPEEVIKKPEDGDNVYLTIDQKIQTLLEDTLTQVEEEYDPERMTAIVMDPKTGEIVAMSSRPSYNPNNPANVENWYNDAISTPMEPGSTMKMFTWAAAMQEGVYNGEEGFESGSYRPNERLEYIHDHNNEGWGTISYDEGFERSSNVAAAKLLWEKIGPETYLDYLHAFDFDKETGIDLPGEQKGQILYNWPLEKITTAFGQGTTVTPIQQMKAATAIANDGKMMQPYVLQKIVDPATGDKVEEKSPNQVGEPISESTAEQVRSLLGSAVSEDHGSGKKNRLEDYSVGGKTGTAQIPDPEGNGYMTGKENYMFSFLGMAPIDDPQLMMYVSVQQPELDAGEYGSDPVSFVFTNVMENSLHYLNIEPDKDQETAAVEEVEFPGVMEEDAETAEQTLTELGLNVSLIGDGKVVAANVQEGEKILPGERVILVTDNPVMPDVTGWSLRDIQQLAGLMELQIETFGNGYVVTQHIKEGTPLKEGDYLGVELAPPDGGPLDANQETEENAEDEEP